MDLNFTLERYYQYSLVAKMIQAKVLSNECLDGENYLLTLERKIDFLPGQVIAVTLGDIAPRLYSIASGVNDDFIQILYTINPQGVLTPKLASLKVGERLHYSKARGTFLNEKKDSIWLATGTGIAPFVSMARSDLEFDRYVKALVHGTRGPYHFGADLFKKLLGSKYVRYVSGPQLEVDDSKPGRIGSYFDDEYMFDRKAEYYLCGKAEMVVEMRDLLIGKGIDYSKIKSEIYF